MRDIGIPELKAWRWAPCAALVLGSLSFVAFALLAIPERIGGAAAEGAATLELGNRFTAAQASPPGGGDWPRQSAQLTSGTSAHVDSALPGNPTRVATNDAGAFPKRGFTPPLERPEPPPPPPVLTPPPAAPAPAVVEATPVPPPPLDAPAVPLSQQQAEPPVPVPTAAEATAATTTH